MNPIKTPMALFRLGRILSTPNALAKIDNEDILAAIQKHQAGDWGDLDQKDREANDRALEEGTRLLSIYHSARRIKFWIITEADRSATTVLMPEDY